MHAAIIPGRITLVYTFKYTVNVYLEHTADGLQLSYIEPQNDEEYQLVLGEDCEGDGELACWDAGVEIKDGVVYLYGSDGPGGGKRNVELRIPLSLAVINIERIEPTFKIVTQA